MKSKGIGFLLWVLGLLHPGIPMVLADEPPPPGSKPLSAILKSGEGQKLGVITSPEFDDGWWEVKVCKGPACQKLYIDPRSGEEKPRRKADSHDEAPSEN